MAPTKVTMEYIANGSTRKLACKKRTMGVMKKAGELSTLCGVEVCCMVLPEGEPSSQMQVWPSLPEATSMIDRLKAMPEVDRRRKEMDGEDYVRERIGKVKEQLCKAERDNRQRETTLRIHDAMVGRWPNVDGLTAEQLTGIGWTTENLAYQEDERLDRVPRWAAGRRGGRSATYRRRRSPPSAGMGHGGGQGRMGHRRRRVQWWERKL
ncbi:hypothetical protein ACQ4PT_013076 [Festuca glaucescens]